MNRSFNPHSTNVFEEFVELSEQIAAPSKVATSTGGNQATENRSPKIILSPVTGKIRELRISKSLINQLIYKGEPYPVCSYNVYHTMLLRDIVVPTSEAQLKGLYFETKCLGSSAGGQVTVDLPRHKKTGAKLSDHERIDQAIGRFYDVVKEYGLIVDSNYTQIYRKRLWVDPDRRNKTPVFLDGTLDFISPITTPRYSLDVANIDLKLTRDRDTCDSFNTGLYHPTPWGCPEKMSFTEAMMYRVIFDLPFVYLVFDYKKENAGFKDIPIITDINDPDPLKASIAQKRMDDLYNTLRWVCDAIFRWESLHWPMEPNTLVCQKCVIADCPKRIEKVEI
ncbi:MAG: hypothetical protein WCI71_11040 [Bacteroidota bacterium]